MPCAREARTESPRMHEWPSLPGLPWSSIACDAVGSAADTSSRTTAPGTRNVLALCPPRRDHFRAHPLIGPAGCTATRGLRMGWTNRAARSHCRSARRWPAVRPARPPGKRPPPRRRSPVVPTAEPPIESPPAAAQTPCSDVVRGQVQAGTSASSPCPVPESVWEDNRYFCTYQTAEGPLVYAVRVASTDASRRGLLARRCAASTAPAPPLTGLQEAYQNGLGTVVARHDNLVLSVDASALPRGAPRPRPSHADRPGDHPGHRRGQRVGRSGLSPRAPRCAPITSLDSDRCHVFPAGTCCRESPGRVIDRGAAGHPRAAGGLVGARRRPRDPRLLTKGDRADGIRRGPGDGVTAPRWTSVVLVTGAGAVAHAEDVVPVVAG